MSKPTARKLQAKTAPQSELMSAIREHDVTVATGSAGTGKTYIVAAVFMDGASTTIFTLTSGTVALAGSTTYLCNENLIG